MEQVLNISWQTIIKIFIAGLVAYLLFLVRDIVVWFLFALIISLLFEPLISFLQKLYFPKVMAVIMVYLSIFGVLGAVIYFSAPIFIYELQQLSKNIPDYFNTLNPLLKNLGVAVGQNFEDFSASIISTLQASSESIFKAITAVFGGIASTILIFVFAFYISLETKGVETVLSYLAPKKYEGYVLSIFERAQYKVAGWFGARVLACVFVGIVSFIVFFLFGIKYALILAVISGALTFIPFIGPTFTALLVALSVGVSNSWILAAYIVVALAVIQQIENSFVTPLLMKKFLDLPPLLVLIALLVGSMLFGILGMVFLVPVFGIIYEFLKEFLRDKKQMEVA